MTHNHDLYQDGDANVPDSIKDQNGHVALDLCKRCGRAEVDLDTPCVAHGDQPASALLDLEAFPPVPTPELLREAGLFDTPAGHAQWFRDQYHRLRERIEHTQLQHAAAAPEHCRACGGSGVDYSHDGAGQGQLQPCPDCLGDPASEEGQYDPHTRAALAREWSIECETWSDHSEPGDRKKAHWRFAADFLRHKADRLEREGAKGA